MSAENALPRSADWSRIRAGISPVENAVFRYLGNWAIGCLGLCLLLLLPQIVGAATKADYNSMFENANRLYEQEKFTEAAAAYQGLVAAGVRSPEVFYNLGSAFFKASQNGRALAAYRQAQTLEPRDANLRFNLEFVRKHVTGDEHDPRPRWQQLIQNLTVNEWTGLTIFAYWACALLLIASEIWSRAIKTVRQYALLFALASIVFLGCLISANYATRHANAAVVVVPNAVVRRGPLEEAPVSYQLPDGSEVNVLDEKELIVGDRKQQWLQVQNGRGVGWLQRDQVVLLQPTKRVAA